MGRGCGFFRLLKVGQETTAQDPSKYSVDIRGYLVPGIPEDSLMVEPPGVTERPLNGIQTLPGRPTGRQ